MTYLLSTHRQQGESRETREYYAWWSKAIREAHGVVKFAAGGTNMHNAMDDIMVKYNGMVIYEDIPGQSSVKHLMFETPEEAIAFILHFS